MDDVKLTRFLLTFLQWDDTKKYICVTEHSAFMTNVISPDGASYWDKDRASAFLINELKKKYRTLMHD